MYIFMMTFSQILSFGYFIGFVILICFIIPILLRAAEFIKNINAIVSKNEDNFINILKNVGGITKSVDEVSEYTKDKITNIDKYVESIQKGAKLLKKKKGPSDNH